MNEDRETLARWIDNERERIVSFCTLHPLQEPESTR
jgi:hypothetical protein